MNGNTVPINYSKNEYSLCAYCVKIKGRSKRFRSSFSLTWHITHEHKEDMGIVDISDVSIPKSFMIKREVEHED